MGLEKSGSPGGLNAFQQRQSQWQIVGQTREMYEVHFEVSISHGWNQAGLCYNGCGMRVNWPFLS